ncbi:MAG: elongation factor 1-beta [Candidatus Aenigmarchaeota archaeon]|nr:elongation factor 1-beta [Candidatus Aenigmarchaeota archaeon]MCK5321976.1 elongation factor 1-beta [Candidatus Aenigmarchaeota archaeon]
MGKVATTFKIMPQNPEVDFEKIVEDLKTKIDVKDYKIEPIAFGLKMLKVMVITVDSEGGIDEIESMIGDMDGISEVSVESSTLI